jgi:uncharacterized integral membrane protein
MTSQRANYDLIGNAGIVIGVALVLLAILILFTNMKINRTFDFWGNVTGVSFEFPNVQYSIGLAVVGIIFGAFGSASRIKAKPQIQPPPFSKTPSFCPYCGMQNTPDAVFCSKCGKKLT